MVGVAMSLLSFHRGVPLRYQVDASRLAEGLRAVFLPLSLDDTTRHFIDDALDRPTATARLALRRAARAFLSDYDANALFDTHSMRVLGREQWVALLPGVVDRWLDVGAGDGRVTDELRPLAREVVTTETSPRMADRLRARGLFCHGVDLSTHPLPDRGRFDVVSALNVLDRTHRPYSLVERMRDLLVPGGTLILAVPLPLSPHVHVAGGVVDPDELLPIDRRGFEEAASTLVDVGLRPLGLEPTFATRVPYLSRGDRDVRIHVLDDFVVGLRRRGEAQLST